MTSSIKERKNGHGSQAEAASAKTVIEGPFAQSVGVLVNAVEITQLSLLDRLNEVFEAIDIDYEQDDFDVEIIDQPAYQINIYAFPREQYYQLINTLALGMEYQADESAPYEKNGRLVFDIRIRPHTMHT